MIQIVNFKEMPTRTRLAIVMVRYFDIIIRCDLCIYKDEHLWVRMPEEWKGDTKYQYVFWEDKKRSDDFQQEVLTKIYENFGYDVAKAMDVREQLRKQRKESTITI